VSNNQKGLCLVFYLIHIGWIPCHKSNPKNSLPPSGENSRVPQIHHPTFVTRVGQVTASVQTVRLDVALLTSSNKKDQEQNKKNPHFDSVLIKAREDFIPAIMKCTLNRTTPFFTSSKSLNDQWMAP